MILKSFKYSSRGWSLNHLSLGYSNLIVGKNSAGKSRSLEALQKVRTLLDGSLEVEDVDDLKTALSFVLGEDVIDIEIRIQKGRVVKEIFCLNGHVVIDRNEVAAEIDGEIVNPPVSKLLMHVRRDVARYPHIEAVIEWAERTIVRSFVDSDSLSNDQLYKLVSNFSVEMKKHVVDMVRSVGFPLVTMDTFENAFNISSDKIDSSNLERFKFILFKEENVPAYLYLNDLSNGMRRTVVTLIFLEHIINESVDGLVAIDDLGEGLDYLKATKVGRLVFDLCEKHGVQLLATSNEEFMMNVVDIDKWNILIRRGQRIRSLTPEMRPEVFEKFKFSGLDNFDFFTSDVFTQALELQ